MSVPSAQQIKALTRNRSFILNGKRTRIALSRNASWAVWGERTDDLSIFTGVRSVPDDQPVHVAGTQLHTDIVMVGAHHGALVNPVNRNWWSFHGTGRDHTLRKVVQKMPFLSGAYLTSMAKRPVGGRDVTSAPEHEHASVLATELRLLGANRPLLVVMADDPGQHILTPDIDPSGLQGRVLPGDNARMTDAIGPYNVTYTCHYAWRNPHLAGRFTADITRAWAIHQQIR